MLLDGSALGRLSGVRAARALTYAPTERAPIYFAPACYLCIRIRRLPHMYLHDVLRLLWSCSVSNPAARVGVVSRWRWMDSSWVLVACLSLVLQRMM